MNTLLSRTGEALYGEHWQKSLSEELDINERTIRRWLAGEVIPLGVWKELFIKLDVRKEHLEFLLGRVRENLDVGKK